MNLLQAWRRWRARRGLPKPNSPREKWMLEGLRLEKHAQDHAEPDCRRCSHYFDRLMWMAYNQKPPSSQDTATSGDGKNG